LTSKVRSNAPHRLIVEGNDDLYSIIALTARHGWNWDSPDNHLPYIKAAGGDEPALQALVVGVRSHRRVGIVIDADATPTDRWSAIRGRLAGAGVALPDSPHAGGTIVEHNGVRVGIWMMPDNRNAGKLEDFLGLLIPEGNLCWPWAEEAMLRASSQYGAEFSEPDRIKARVHTWLAWQESPGLPFGTAIKAAMFSHNAVIATAFVDWMTRLYA